VSTPHRAISCGEKCVFDGSRPTFTVTVRGNSFVKRLHVHFCGQIVISRPFGRGLPRSPARTERTPGCPRHSSRSPASGAGFRVQGAGCRVQGSGCRVQGSGCRVQGAGCRVQGAGFRVQGWRGVFLTSGYLLGCVPNLRRMRCRVTSLIRNSADLEPYSKAKPRALWWS